MTSVEWAVVAGLLIGAYVFIIGIWWRSAEAIKGERMERETAIEAHEKQDETRRDKVIEAIEKLGDKVDAWAERVGERQGKVEQDVAVLKARAEK